MKNWNHSIHQHVQKFESTKLELFCFIFVEVIKKFMGPVFFVFLFFWWGSPCTYERITETHTHAHTEFL